LGRNFKTGAERSSPIKRPSCLFGLCFAAIPNVRWRHLKHLQGIRFGGAGGRLTGNRFIVAPEWTSVANVLLSVADMFGTPLDKFGESTGRVQL
jgi:hypothetical protein